jgi:hypothetical protein
MIHSTKKGAVLTILVPVMNDDPTIEAIEVAEAWKITTGSSRFFN